MHSDNVTDSPVARSPRNLLRRVFRPRGLVTSDGTLDMERYFSRYLLVNTHIPKTGGSTFVTSLRTIFGEEHVYDIRGGFPMPRKLPREQLSKIWALSGHFWFDTHDRPIARKKKYLVTVRDPVDRFISLYNYVAAAKSHPGHAKYGVLDIEGAFRYLKENTPNQISNTVCQMFGERVFSTRPRMPGRVVRNGPTVPFEHARDMMEKHYALVIPIRRLDDAIKGLGKAFGRDIPIVHHQNIGGKKVTELSEDIRQELRDLNKEDYKLNAYYEERFDEHLNNLQARLLGRA